MVNIKGLNESTGKSKRSKARYLRNDRLKIEKTGEIARNTLKPVSKVNLQPSMT
jgi:hypothetical protein